MTTGEWHNKLKEIMETSHFYPDENKPSSVASFGGDDEWNEPQDLLAGRESHEGAASTQKSDAFDAFAERHAEFLEAFSFSGRYALSHFDHMADRNAFAKEWQLLGINGKEHLLEARKLWVAMKGEGEVLADAMEKRALDSLERAESDGGHTDRLYHLVHIYASLDASREKIFFSKLLSYEKVWNNPDGSTTGFLCERLGKSGDPSVAPELLRYLDHLVSPEYAASEFRSMRIVRCTRALEEVLGAESAAAYEAYAEKSTTFSEWWEKKKALSLFSPAKAQTSLPEVLSAPFDAKEEAEYLKILEHELESARDLSDSGAVGHDPYFDPHDDHYHDDHEDFPEYPEEADPPSPKERELYQKKTINFYGRFRPHLERPVTLTEENTLRALASVTKKEHSTPEDFLNILSGVIDETELLPELPREWKPDELKTFTKVVCTRALTLAVIENDVERAKNEVMQAVGYLDRQVDVQKDLAGDVSISWCFNFLRRLSGSLDRFSVSAESAGDELPESAKQFFVYHQQFRKMREIPAFEELLAEKLRFIVALRLSEQLSDGDEFLDTEYWTPESFRGVQRSAKEFYRSIEANDVPVYWEASESLDEAGAQRCVVFGRDGRYLFTALKAADFGKGARECKYVLVTRNIENNERRVAVAEYLKQHGVELDSYFIDTGYRGSIPEFAIKALAHAGGVEISDEEVNKRIKLLSSSEFGRQSLAARRKLREGSDPVDRIEDRPHQIESPSFYEVTPDGKLLPHEDPKSSLTQLYAWVVEHSVMRNFAPRFEPEKRVKRPKEMEHHRFLERFVAVRSLPHTRWNFGKMSGEKSIF
ncbi:MAG: hypothetical protein A3H76_05255 [Candidatus Lloydbacteria bacterium RIFCSPLOWO2_02_FULL_54_12]|nr:MAG: hypothetical protein A3H76_05255 [Candidatus Lloydbacteria bacterium RIFCSPLOWO2_02_FULL_54_12]